MPQRISWTISRGISPALSLGFFHEFFNRSPRKSIHKVPSGCFFFWICHRTPQLPAVAIFSGIFRKNFQEISSGIVSGFLSKCYFENPNHYFPENLPNDSSRKSIRKSSRNSLWNSCGKQDFFREFLNIVVWNPRFLN